MLISLLIFKNNHINLIKEAKIKLIVKKFAYNLCYKVIYMDFLTSNS